ncbi:MAG: nucleotidyltransferase domain-containing protein [Prolixibacteraceae bacterium]|nr:nucleotidyltransferase domain-containing protein [Prolixibacteraceae bacterium]
MDKDDAIKIAQRYLSLVEKKYNVVEAILFGSFAKGTNHQDSDIDIAIIFKSADDIINLQIELLKMRTEEDLLIEPHPFRAVDFKSSNPVVSEILKSGIKIIRHAA